MASRPDERQEDETQRSPSPEEEEIQTSSSSTTVATAPNAPEDRTGEEEEESAADKEEEEQEEEEQEEEEQEEQEEQEEEGVESEQKLSTPSRDRPAPPTSLALSAPRPTKKKVLAAPALSLSLGRSESGVSDDFPSGFLSPSPEDGEDTGLDFDLDAMETPSDSESLPFPIYDLEDDLQRLGVASRPHRAFRDRRGSGSLAWAGPQARVGAESHVRAGTLEQEDQVDNQGIRWRCFSTGDPPQETRVNMSVLEPFLRVLSHGGYYGDGMNDIIVFSSCYLPENSLDNYQYVMDNLFRYVVGTVELMVAEDYVMVYLCAGGQKDRLPGISWLKECYTTIDRRLRKNLKGFYVVHPTWYVKALITIIKPFISSKFSRKLRFIDSLQELSQFIPTEHVQIPDCVREYDQELSR
ncbi:bcl-2/adenovirus E1B 19 kDa-interacting protein 2-like protein [Mugil cephalus]|uniref:bcl-2/adenovirus E1B 19 kDa-interacting protein 2-like protein n=1 Tax=Mugil cephalus TaxID=48193 RepID=UPI001FB859DC|nr:bcl-2/adenovirus E1B 19 kDa-interacting protein 2-like protein [Mugil cephalus]XP_047461927.1 bcl-2/adenovirus E1B 19 kDa-interacting protein 2-like protein [Mugil cephalus]XP_047461928.1 bcl-2/adenovirus E1B 19 kDa-interacting protein 2-like protein [Mugil cephalus]XP_047461929.1 bcl-2/adenovirus E1B 19 kDa-interacting protein 2-like protein [Mugil cephalus]